MSSCHPTADTADLKAIVQDQPPFGALFELAILSATPERIEAEFTASPAMANRNGVLHGGAIMGVADSLGGAGAFLHLGEAEQTTTLESKTNFLRAIAIGSRVRVVAVPLHKGRRTMIWQTTLLREDGKPAAIVTQTQMVIEARRD